MRGVPGWCVFVLLALALCGCTEPGPRALLRGERLLREGKFEQAIEQLQTATRLLPRNAQAWNHLGLAHHYRQEAAQARRMYLQALALDYNLAAARYNLGCLLLEQNDAAGALEPLTSYTILHPNRADGWLKLGSAQVRIRRYDAAEKSFRTALGLESKSAEALNGLGVVQYHRKRLPEALASFHQALAQDADYGPALLNAAVLTHQTLNNRTLALELYRKYLALSPRAAEWETVSAAAGQLEAELKPAPAPAPAPAATPPPAIAAARTPPLPLTAAEPPVRPPAQAASPPPAAATATRSNLGSQAPAPKPQPPSTTAVASASPPVAAPPKPTPVKEVPKPVPAPAELEVTRLPDDLVIRPPQEIANLEPNRSGNAPAPPRTVVPTPAPVPDTPVVRTEKRGFLSRLNPFGGRSKPTTDRTVTVPASDPRAVPEPVFPERSEAVTEMAARPAATTAISPPAPTRYTYISPPRPSPGKRAEAERHFAQGVKAQRAGRPAEALAEYQRAVQADPAYFEAYCNQGLAAYDTRNWQAALRAYEFALALRPGSADARYNFAQTLKQANFPLDAADELIALLKEHPDQTRAHLSLGNLYAQQLSQPKRAREHYLRFLEKEPRHPQASEIRFWLAAHP